MSAGVFGYIIGGFLGSLLLPILVLIAAKFIGPMKQHPRIVYSISSILTLPVPALAASVSLLWGPAAISVALALLVLFWDYRRSRRKTPGGEPTV